MEKEVSQGVDLAVTLVALSALIGLIVATVMIGKNLMNDVVNASSDVQNSISVAFVQDLAKGDVDNEMPTATAFNILTTYDKVIATTGCGVCGEERHLLTQRTCLSNHLSSRVQLEVLNKKGTIITLIHDNDCNWFVGVCDCPGKAVFTTVKNKYGF